MSSIGFSETNPLPGPPRKGEGDIQFLAKWCQLTGSTLPLAGREGRGF